MRISFYFDPCCPFCWITAQWLQTVEPERDIQITWKPFSLAIKNDELDDDTEGTTGKGAGHRASHRVLRLLLSAEKEHGAKLIDLYNAFGFHYFVDKKPYEDDAIKQILETNSLPQSLLSELDNTDHDTALAESMQSAIEVAGQDIGVPTILFEGGDEPIGYFGPVLQTLPTKADGLALWDGLAKLASDTNFYELKRSRPSGGPDVASTASVRR